MVASGWWRMAADEGGELAHLLLVRLCFALEEGRGGAVVQHALQPLLQRRLRRKGAPAQLLLHFTHQQPHLQMVSAQQ